MQRSGLYFTNKTNMWYLQSSYSQLDDACVLCILRYSVILTVKQYNYTMCGHVVLYLGKQYFVSSWGSHRGSDILQGYDDEKMLKI